MADFPEVKAGDLPPLTVSEARAILRADEALVAAATTFDDEEREAWIALVKSATERVGLYHGLSPKVRYP